MVDSSRMPEKLELFVREETLFDSGAKILLAISGGADSTALLYMFSKLRSKMRLSLLAVHVNHQLRGNDSTTDENFCKELCLHHNIPLIVRKIELKGKDLENEARNKRFQIFDQILGMYRFDKIATGHHKNDQAETILMNMMRGAGINGMAGIKPSNGKIIHPFLCFSHQELINYLQAENVKWCEDSSNQNTIYKRNLIRNEFIPMIEANFNPAFVEKIAKQATLFRKTDRLLSEIGENKYKKSLIEQHDSAYIFSIPILMKLTDIERYYIFKQVFRILAKTDKDFFLHSYEEIMALCRSNGSKSCRLQHGIHVQKQYDELSFVLGENRAPEVIAEPASVDIERSFMVHMDYRFAFKHLKLMPKDPFVFASHYSIVIDLDKVTMPMCIRPRKAGDRFVVIGMGKEKKLKEFFIDEKVPKYERDKIPIIADEEKIIWVVGHRMNDRVRCDENTTRFLHISAEHTGQGRKRTANRKS